MLGAALVIGSWMITNGGGPPDPLAAPWEGAAPAPAISEYRVGDCIADTEGQQALIACDQPHLWEVIHVGVAPEQLAPDGTSTGLARLSDEATRQCAPVFTAYTGQPIETAVDISMHLTYPTQFEWAQGDRALVCGVGRAGALYTGLIGPPPA